MAILIRFKEGQAASVDEVTAATYAALEAEGMTVRESDIKERDDGLAVCKVLGVINYRGVDYDVMYRDKVFTRAGAQNTRFFDMFKIEDIHGAVKFVQTGVEIGPGMIPPIADFYFEPSEDKMAFLRRFGAGLKQNLPCLDLAVVAYNPGRSKMAYEKVD